MGYNGIRASSKPRRRNTLKGYRSGKSIFFKSINLALTGKTYVRKPSVKKNFSNAKNSGCLVVIVIFLVVTSTLAYFYNYSINM